MQKMGFRLFENDVRIFSNSRAKRLGYAEPKIPLNLSVVPPWSPAQPARKAFVAELERVVQRHGTQPWLTSYRDQMAYVSRVLWPRYFAGPLASTMPPLAQLPYEDVVIDFLIGLVEANEGLPARVLLDPAMRATALSAFGGIWGCWTEDKGSHFFWGVEDGKFVQLRVVDGALVNPAAGMRIPLVPQEIIAALRGGQLVPTLMIAFGVAAFHCGLQCVGGLRQLTYLPEMQRGWKTVAEVHAPAELEPLSAVATTSWGGGSWSTFYQDRALWGLEAVAIGGIGEAELEHWLDKPLGELLARERRLVKDEPMGDADRCPRCPHLRAAEVEARVAAALDG
jgi:hypothetical protein